jgi:galactokinase
VLADIVKTRETIAGLFRQRFGSDPLLVRSPGRVNLIGEHTDYNEGFVLPAAVDKAIVLAAAPRNDRRFRFVAADLHQDDEGSFEILAPSPLGWPDYLLGIVDQLEKTGRKVPGVDLVFGGTIPIGAGMSSSAAVEAGFLFLLNAMFDLGIPLLDMAKMAQRAENEFIGVRCGIMDQFANLFGTEGHVLRLDCRSLQYEAVPFRRADVSIVLCDTMVRHELASSEYNKRRRQCEEGVEALRRRHPAVKSLRDATPEMLADVRDLLDPVVERRCRYVVEENGRVLEGCADLRKGDLEAFGGRMILSHEGLRDLYEVSCRELDTLVEAALKLDGVFGARMMGGGFGGCTINLVREDCVEDFAREIPEVYRDAIGREMNLHLCRITGGTSLIQPK